MKRRSGGRNETDAEATPNRYTLCSQVRSPLFGVLRVRIWIECQALPLQKAPVSGHRCRRKTLDRKALGSIDRLGEGAQGTSRIGQNFTVDGFCGLP